MTLSFVMLAVLAQTPPAPQQFEVVSIKPCSTERPVSGVAPARAGGRGGGAAGWHAQTTPGHVYWDCVTLATLIDQAYADVDHPLLNTTGDSRPPRTDGLGPVRPKRVRGGPAWVDTDMFTIEVKSPVALTTAGLAGAAGRNLATLPVGMSLALRAALEDRFQLKVRRELEPRDLYDLVVSKDGINTNRVKPTKKGECVSREEYAAIDPADRMGVQICGIAFVELTGTTFTGFTMQQFAAHLSGLMDRFVVNKTGLEGAFSFQTLRSDSGDPGLTNLLPALGLRAEPVKGQGEYILIERVERPRPN
jgi:uncharacterized protein (TIGR03435 family)